MNKTSCIAIIGGGIGGLTTAIALYQKGFRNITVYERRAATKAVGAGLVLWANATWVLNKLTLLNEVSEFGGTLNQMQRWTSQGDYLGAIEIERIDKGIGYPSLSVSKPELQCFLQAKVKEYGIAYHNNITIKAIDDGNHARARLVLEDKSTIDADVIIAADGRMQSIARKYIHGNNQPVYQDYVNWVGIIEHNESLSIGRNVLDFWGCGERFGIVPINETKAYWAGCKRLPLTSVNTASTNKEELLNIFKKWPSIVTFCIDKTDDKNIKRIPVFDLDPNPIWFKNNVCLLGDAAHASLPTGGQGACQAIEDTWHLANQLETFDTVHQSFEAYQNLRLKKTTAITLSARDFARSLFNTDEVFCHERNTNARLTDYHKATDSILALWSSNLVD